MRTLNSRTNKEIPEYEVLVDDFDTVYPCWYAEIEKSDKREDYKWKFGCKFNGKDNSNYIRFSDIGNINDNRFWAKAMSYDFVLGIVSGFRSGGRIGVLEWLKEAAK